MMKRFNDYDIEMNYFSELYPHIFVTLEKTGVYANSSKRGDGAQVAVSTRIQGLEEIIIFYPDLATQIVARMTAECISQIEASAHCSTTDPDDEFVQNWAKSQVERRRAVLIKAST